MRGVNVRRLFFIVLVMLLAGLQARPGVVHSQTTETLPPVVVEALPIAGEELALNEPITLTFDQPMERGSIEAALTFTPKLPENATLIGQWKDDLSVDLKLQEGWPRNTQYTVTVGKAARSRDGLALEAPYEFRFRTLGPLKVGSVNPEPDSENVALFGSQIIINFNRSMFPVTVDEDLSKKPSPIRIAPDISGEGRWVNASLYSFTPSQPLPPNTTYTVTTTPGLTAADGGTLEATYSWKFKTAPPGVNSISYLVGSYETNYDDDRKGFRPDVGIVAKFSNPMTDHAGIQKATSLIDDRGVAISGAFFWSKTDTQLTFKPHFPLRPATQYTFTIEAGVISVSQSTTFRTRPPLSVDRLSFNYDGFIRSIRFSDSPIPESLYGRVSISPDPGFYLEDSPDGDSYEIHYDKEKIKPGAEYTLTIKKGVLDSFGNPMSEDYVRKFVIPNPPTPMPNPTGTAPDETDTGTVTPVINSDLMLTGNQNPQTSLALRIEGNPTVRVSVYHVSGAELSTELMSSQLDPWRATGYLKRTLQAENMSSYSPDEYPVPPPAPWVKPDHLVQTWTRKFVGDKYPSKKDKWGNSTGSVAVVPLLENGGKLPLGMYWITVEASGSQIMWQYALAVTTTNLTIKRAPRETLVWATDLVTSKPVPNTKVSIYSHGKFIASGFTDSKGVYIGRFNLPASSVRVDPYSEEYYSEAYYTKREFADYITVVAEGANTFGAWYNSDNYEMAVVGGYLHTDRPLYRPGDTVYFRGILRGKFDVTYSLPQEKTIKVRAIQNSAERQKQKEMGDDYYYYGLDRDAIPSIYEATLQLSPYGTFDGSFTIPADAPSDDVVTLYSKAGEIYFSVREFRIPEYEVKVTPEQPSFYMDQDTSATAKASYYFGGAVGNANVEWRVTSSRSYFNYTGPGSYSFYDSAWYNSTYPYEPDQQTEGNGVTDANGVFKINIEKLVGSGTTASNAPRRVRIQASVRDESGQTITGTTSMIAHSSSVYIGADTDGYFVPFGRNGTVKLITVSPDSQPVPNQKVKVDLIRRLWKYNEDTRKWYSEEEEFADTTRTGADGTVQYVWKATKSGYYQLRFSVVDPVGRTSSTTTWLYVTDRGMTLPGWTRGDEENDYYYDANIFRPTEHLQADKSLYKPGETAKILIPAPFDRPATMLVTAERNQILHYDVITTSSTPQTYELKVTDGYAPDMYFTALAIAPIDSKHPLPDWRLGQTFFGVVPTARYLNVTVKPRQTTAKPGSKVDVDVLVTDRDGKPVSAEVGLSVVDKAALALTSPNSFAQKDTFFPIEDYVDDWRWQYNPISVELSSYALQERLVMPPRLDMGGAGGALQPPSDSSGELQIRKDYKTTPLWMPHLVTDKDGKATATVDVPDNLTTWTIDARAVTLTTQVGEGTSEFMSTLPLIVRPVAPRFMVVGDQLELSTVVNNNTGKAQTLKVTLQAKGVILSDPVTQTAQVADGGRVRIAWHVTPEQNATGADLTFIAVGDGAQDAAKPMLATGKDGTIPIYRFVATDVVNISGSMRSGGSQTDVIAIPSRFKEAKGQLTVRIDPSIAASTLDSLDFLRNFPHQCNEQTTSRFLPNLYTLRALQSLGQSQPKLEADLKFALDDGLKRLTDSQNKDGGWGWWPGQDTDDYITSYVLFGLTQARKSGYSIPDDMIARGVEYIRGKMIPVTLGMSNWMLNRQAFLIYMLADAEITAGNDAAVYAALFARRPSMSFGAKAYLLMAYLKRFPNDSAIKDLLTDLESRAKLSASGVSWQEGYADWYNWGSDVRSTALAIAALVRARPDSPLLPNAVRWLMAARKADYWSTTQETTWSLLALTDYMLTTGELKGNYKFTVTLNRKPAGSGAITPENVRTTQTINAQVQDLLTDRANRMTITRDDGVGALYYAATLKMLLPADQVQSVARGVEVQRTYTDDKDHFIKTAKVGDLINVTLTLTVRDEARYVALQDPIPAGTEIENPSLLTNAGRTRVGRLDVDRSRYYYYGWWYFDHREFKDEEARFYANYLPAGTYFFKYQVRATLPGTFQLMPTTATAFYAPEWFGRTGGSVFTVMEK